MRLFGILTHLTDKNYLHRGQFRVGQIETDGKKQVLSISEDYVDYLGGGETINTDDI